MFAPLFDAAGQGWGPPVATFAIRGTLGARGTPRADVHAAAVSLVRLGQLAVAHREQIEAVDVNPLFVLPDGEGVLAGDALVVLR